MHGPNYTSNHRKPKMCQAANCAELKFSPACPKLWLGAQLKNDLSNTGLKDGENIFGNFAPQRVTHHIAYPHPQAFACWWHHINLCKVVIGTKYSCRARKQQAYLSLPQRCIRTQHALYGAERKPYF